MALSGVVSGSFRFLPEILALVEGLKNVGVDVLAPKGASVRGSADVTGGVEGFQLLDEDKSDDPAVLMSAFMLVICKADFHYAYFPDGRCGLSVAAEICWAMYHGIPCIWSGLPTAYSEEVYPEFVQALTEFAPDWTLSATEIVENIGSGQLTEATIRERKDIVQGFLSLFRPVWGPLQFSHYQGKS